MFPNVPPQLFAHFIINPGNQRMFTGGETIGGKTPRGGWSGMSQVLGTFSEICIDLYYFILLEMFKDFY